ncbi:CDP-glycerol glycerophosphotransferase family protein, partial [Methanobrevibacter sp.]|uniref:CDP-glycerol glycerophosphotransferase family protein n=1 Tax=Methanobrevibacter sp. TaxID=66852 RepID=UPI0026E08702
TIEKSQENLDLSKVERIVRLIRDEIILDNILIENETKIFLFKLKYGNINEDLMEKLNLNTVLIDVYDIINNQLNILASITNISDRSIELFINGKKVKTKVLRFPQYDNYSLGRKYTQNYSIQAKIPLSTNEKYEIEFKSENKSLKIDFSRPCNFSRSVGYAKTKDFLSILKNEKIIVKRKTALNWINQELKSLVHMIKKHEKGFEKAIPFRIAYMIGYPFFKNKRIWFYMDRPNESDDNGIHLFKYSVKINDNIDRYFILSSDNEDFDEIKKTGPVLKYKSLKHRFLGLYVENIISSHPDNGIIYPFWGGYPFFAGLLKSNNIFLQHGILKDNISGWLNKRNMNLSFFLVSSKREYDSTFKYPYNYDKGVVQLRGLPRYDNLENVEDKKQILIIPSWRRYLTGKSNEFIKETEFFKRFNSLLNNEKLIEKAKDYDYEIIFRPHPNVYNFIDLYDENDYVKIDHDKTKFQTLFNNGSLLITDYSSVAFDFAYLHKPVIYYQYGEDYHFDVENSFFNYETMGLGDICKNEDELVDLIIEYVENECSIKEKYSKRIDEFFLFTDRNNCKRVHEAIKKIPLKD